MNVALLVITDGRDGLIHETIASAEEHLHGPRFAHKIIYDDSGNMRNRQALTKRYRDWTVCWHPSGRQGFGGAIRAAWSHVRATNANFVFHLEDDFTFNRDINMHEMINLLTAYPYIVQVALRRQPWNSEEIAAGGVVELHPEDFKDMQDDELGLHWLEHTRFFTTNPCMYRADLIDLCEWPTGRESEGRFTMAIRARFPDMRFAYWGSRESGEWVRHNGVARAGTGY